MIIQKAAGSFRLLVVIGVFATLLTSGCAKQKVVSEYGRRVGRQGASSVNGTGVLMRMFRSGGARVKTSTRLGRIVDNAEVVVWIPDRYASPSKPTREFFEDWLAANPNRTLIFVGRDYDATTTYWQYLVDHAPADKPGQYIEARKKLAEARVAEATQRSVYDPKDDCDWFAIDRSKPSRRVTKLDGPLRRGVVDETAIDLELNTRIEKSQIVKDDDAGYRGRPKFKSLLSSDGDIVVGKFTRQNWSGSQIIVVANGSWLLNLPLVNHEHRRLAGNLIGECGKVDQVVFLESGPGEPAISSHEPNQHHGLAAFTVWPINCILMHLLALGILFCYSVFPIFGRPRRMPEAETSDFGKHVYAIGELMEHTGDRQYATQVRENYFHRVSDSSTASDGHQAGPVVSTAKSVTTASVSPPTAPTSPSSLTSNENSPE